MISVTANKGVAIFRRLHIARPTGATLYFYDAHGSSLQTMDHLNNFLRHLTKVRTADALYYLLILEAFMSTRKRDDRCAALSRPFHPRSILLAIANRCVYRGRFSGYSFPRRVEKNAANQLQCGLLLTLFTERERDRKCDLSGRMD